MPVTIDFRANAAAFEAALKQADRALVQQEKQLEKLKAAAASGGKVQVEAIQKAEAAIKSQQRELENLRASEQKSAAHKARAAARAEELTKQQQRSLQELKRAVAQVTNEETRMGREAARVLREIQTPQEQYNQKVAKLKTLLDANKLSQDQYNAAVAKAKDKLDQAGKSGEQAFGAKTLQSLASYASGVLSVTAAIALVKQGLGEVIRLGEEAAARARGSITDVGQLRQVATSQEDFEYLAGRARQLQAMGLEEGRAAQIVFAGRSAGMAEEEVTLLGRMEATGFVGDTASMARNVKAVQQAMGVEETGGFREIVGKALAASGGAPAAAEEILQATAVAAGGLGNLKVSDEELLASVASVSNVSGADIAGTQVRSLLFALGEAGAKGEVDLSGATGLMDMVGRVEAMGLNDEQLMKLLGRKEAIAAYRLLSRNRGQVGELQAQVDTAVESGLLEERMGFRDASQAAAVLAEKGKAAADIADVELGTAVNLGKELEGYMDASMTQAGYSYLGRVYSRNRNFVTDMIDPSGKAERIAREFLFNAPEEAVQTQGYQQGIRAIAADPEAYGIDTKREREALERAVQALEQAAAKQLEAAEAQRRATETGPALVAPGEDR